MGSAVACFLARDHGIAATVIERDPTYTVASSALSASSIRQQFSTPVNIALSRWSLGFLRRLGRELAVNGDAPDIGLVEPGYLYLATPAGADDQRRLNALQRDHGVAVDLLDAPALGRRFPWLHTDDLALGSLGLSTADSGEGWFDGPALMQAFRRKAIAHGARFVAAEATGFDTQGPRVTAVRCGGGAGPGTPAVVPADALVLCAGGWSAPLAAALGVDLPVSRRKRDVFVLDTPARLPGCPLVIDPSGVWFRPEGRGFIAGAPPRDGDPAGAPLDAIDHGLFDEHIWPTLAARVPAFEAMRVRSAWAGYYEMNDFDHNGLAGELPGWANAYTACGFSGHGMQQSPAVGAALAAQVVGASGRGLADIATLSPSRLRSGKPIRELNVI